ncbi:MAG: N-acetylmuramoyl-L-alanine amidase, partial [Bacteroidetes bacterium CG23_combo_of_CG06-09_8_20_14_all_32_9]
MRIATSYAGLLFLLIFINFNSFAQTSENKFHIKTVVIDAGHGGKDPGAVGNKGKEKNITLAVALKLGKYIETNFKDVKVIYTRKTDEFIELFKRAQIANINKADLFICIHVNSSKKKESFGTETYVMGLHKTEGNLEVAMTENAVITKEDNYQNQYEGFDPYSPEAFIIFSLYQNAYLDQSLKI